MRRILVRAPREAERRRRRGGEREPQHQEADRDHERGLVGDDRDRAADSGPTPATTIVVRRPRPKRTRPAKSAPERTRSGERDERDRGDRGGRAELFAQVQARPRRPSIPRPGTGAGRSTPGPRAPASGTGRRSRTASRRPRRAVPLGSARPSRPPSRPARRPRTRARRGSRSPAARSAPATSAPVTPPSAYVACIHCRTGRRDAAPTRCAGDVQVHVDRAVADARRGRSRHQMPPSARARRRRVATAIEPSDERHRRRQRERCSRGATSSITPSATSERACSRCRAARP